MKKKIINYLFFLGVIFYVCFIIWNILFKYCTPLELFSSNREYYRSLNLIPFNDVINGKFNKLDIIGNMILFIPLGIYISMLHIDSKIYKNLFKILCISLIFELIQYLFGLGASDTTDVITNVIGGTIGIGIYLILKIFFKDSMKKVIAICSTIVMVPIVIYIVGVFIYN